MNLADYKAMHPEIFDLAYEIGTAVLIAREKAGLTQKELAKLAGMKQPSVARLEAGNSLPTVRLLKIIADALNLNLQIKFYENNQ